MHSIYQSCIAEAKKVFNVNFTCKIDTAPHGEEFEVAVITWHDDGEKWDNVQICLVQFPACFMQIYLRKGDIKILHISTQSGGVKELWEMVKPIIKLEAKGAIGFYTTKPIRDFSYKELQDELDRRNNEREIEIQATHDAEMAQA